MKIAMVGSGYVGLVSGACFAASLETGSGKMDVPVTVRIDNAIEYQEIAGFGATTLAGIMLTENGLRDMLGATLRHQAIKAVYHDVGLTLGSLELWLEPSDAGLMVRVDDIDAALPALRRSASRGGRAARTARANTLELP